MATASEILPPVISEARGERRSRLISILVITAILAVGVLAALFYFLFDPTKVVIFPPCLFHQLTGLDCPGCGAQRALHQLLHGHLIAAIRLNAMFVVSLPLLAWMGFRFLARNPRHQSIQPNARWWTVYIAAWVVFGIARNLPFPICQWFAA
jgi:hypothetical protein